MISIEKLDQMIERTKALRDDFNDILPDLDGVARYLVERFIYEAECIDGYLLINLEDKK